MLNEYCTSYRISPILLQRICGYRISGRHPRAPVSKRNVAAERKTVEVTCRMQSVTSQWHTTRAWCIHEMLSKSTHGREKSACNTEVVVMNSERNVTLDVHETQRWLFTEIIVLVWRRHELKCLIRIITYRITLSVNKSKRIKSYSHNVHIKYYLIQHLSGFNTWRLLKLTAFSLIILLNYIHTL